MKTLTTQKITSDEQKILKEAKQIIEEANSSNVATRNRKKSNTNKLIFILIALLFLLILLVFSFIFAFIESNSSKLAYGISINGINVSNLTKEQALNKLTDSLSADLNNTIVLTHNDYSKEFNLPTADVNYDFNYAINSAYDIGRSNNNIFINNFEILSTFFNKKNINANITYNNDKLYSLVNDINNELPDKINNACYKIDNLNLIVSNSSNGYKVNYNQFINLLTNAVNFNKSSIDIPVELCEADGVDIEKIYNEVHKNPIDAYYSTNPYEIHKEETGLDFAISLDTAKKMVSEKQDTYTIPLKILKPSKTVSNLSNEAFPDLLSTYKTNYSTSSSNRTTNINLAANAVNNYVLMPGEIFSYNNTVGERTISNGYKEAGVYLNGEVTTGIGGGICQVSSTLYNAALLSNLEIVERTNHTFKPTYVPAGQDATVSWGAPDFKFKNNRNYPIKIIASASNGTISFNIYGLKTDNDYEVKIISSEVASIPYSTQYKQDASLPYGTTNITQNGSNGCKTETYKILYKNGIEISRSCINTDTYKPHNQIIVTGTGTY